MDDSRPSELAAKIAAWRASIAGTEEPCESRTLSARGARARPSIPAVDGLRFDPLERALAAERRLEALLRLAAGIVPQGDASRDSYRPPSAWRAFAREVSRAKRHLARVRADI